LLREVHRAVAGGLGADQRAAPAIALSGQNAGELAGDPLVLAEQEPDLPAAHADIAGRDVGELADVPVQLGHERLAEPPHLAVAPLTLRVEIGSALRPAHPQRR